MATLVGKQLKDTYDSLLKTSDNDALDGTYKEITDGSGNGSNLYLGTGGNVGIGATSPSVNLEVNSGTFTGPTVRLSTDGITVPSDTQLGKFEFYNSDASGSGARIASYILSHSAGSTGGGDIRFGVSPNSGTVSEAMRIHNTGDISFRDTSTNEAFYWDASAGSLGIGETSPASPLSIEFADSSTTQQLFKGLILANSNSTANNGAVIAFPYGGSSSNSFARMGAIHTNRSGGSESTDLFFGTIHNGSYSEKMRIDSSGNLILKGNDLDLNNGTTLHRITNSNTDLLIRADYANSSANSTIQFSVDNSEAMRIDSSGNILVGGTTAGTSSAGNLVLFNGTAPTGNVTNGVTLYAEDVSTSSELKVRDEAGNVTTLSPHNFSLIPDGASEPMAWAYYSERDGKKINVDMLKLARMVESLTGEKLVYEQ